MTPLDQHVRSELALVAHARILDDVAHRLLLTVAFGQVGDRVLCRSAIGDSVAIEVHQVGREAFDRMLRVIAEVAPSRTEGRRC